MSQTKDTVYKVLLTAIHAMQITVAITLGSAPGSLAFARDMFLNVRLVAYWQSIARKREPHVNENFTVCKSEKDGDMTMPQANKF